MSLQLLKCQAGCSTMAMLHKEILKQTEIGCCWPPNLVGIRKFNWFMNRFSRMFLMISGFNSNNILKLNHRGQSTHKDNSTCYCSHPRVKKSPSIKHTWLPSMYTICFIFFWVYNNVSHHAAVLCSNEIGVFCYLKMICQSVSFS